MDNLPNHLADIAAAAKKAKAAVGGLDDAAEAWLKKEIHRGELRGQLQLLNFSLDMGKLAIKGLEQKIAAIEAALDGDI